MSVQFGQTCSIESHIVCQILVNANYGWASQMPNWDFTYTIDCLFILSRCATRFPCRMKPWICFCQILQFRTTEQYYLLLFHFVSSRWPRRVLFGSIIYLYDSVTRFAVFVCMKNYIYHHHFRRVREIHNTHSGYAANVPARSTSPLLLYLRCDAIVNSRWPNSNEINRIFCCSGTGTLTQTDATTERAPHVQCKTVQSVVECALNSGWCVCEWVNSKNQFQFIVCSFSSKFFFSNWIKCALYTMLSIPRNIFYHHIWSTANTEIQNRTKPWRQQQQKMIKKFLWKQTSPEFCNGTLRVCSHPSDNYDVRYLLFYTKRNRRMNGT